MGDDVHDVDPSADDGRSTADAAKCLGLNVATILTLGFVGTGDC